MAAPPAPRPYAGEPAFEAAAERQLHERRINLDKIAAVVAFVQIAMGGLDAVSRTGCRTVLFGSLALHAVHAALLFGGWARWYDAHRTAAAAALLAVVRALTALTIQGCNNPTSQDDGVTFTFRLLYKTGFVPLLWYYVALPLPFALSAIFHVAAAVLYNRTLITHACRCVFILPGDDALLSGAWRAVTRAVGSTAPLLGSLLEPRADPGGAGAVVDPRPFCCNWLTGEAGCGEGGPAGGGRGGGGACPVARGAGEVCMAAMTYAQAVLGVWAPLVLGYALLQRTRQRLLAEKLLDHWEAEREEVLRQRQPQQQERLRQLAPAPGGGGVVCGGSELDALHVSPVAVAFATAALSNAACCAVSWAWSV
ncbi:hypothetical protein Rsub_04481 [Raphidocelis subcapitata]|uniref:Uncharacterized protein n=1 Tax=Raphidocelis subcapitata TaxID=307507 RepID=A0A2V0NWX1_9CHLO|nr:hypothetical protein Rsub_04481 [Raphidocelis subcapitata]|eukprot:GBF92134.1 hypothetical protein Rsub_04481 [Raphidocelis subcapitata]